VLGGRNRADAARLVGMDGKSRVIDGVFIRLLHDASPHAAAFNFAHVPFPVAIPFLDRHLQPQLDQPQHIPVDDAAVQ
jgi:hypothetical protein